MSFDLIEFTRFRLARAITDMCKSMVSFDFNIEKRKSNGSAFSKYLSNGCILTLNNLLAAYHQPFLILASISMSHSKYLTKSLCVFVMNGLC